MASKDSCTTGKSTIGDEKSWNVFMRLGTDEAKSVITQCRATADSPRRRATGETEPVKVMAKLRQMKNSM